MVGGVHVYPQWEGAVSSTVEGRVALRGDQELAVKADVPEVDVQVVPLAVVVCAVPREALMDEIERERYGTL